MEITDIALIAISSIIIAVSTTVIGYTNCKCRRIRPEEQVMPVVTEWKSPSPK